jgi:hypothetical protein
MRNARFSIAMVSLLASTVGFAADAQVESGRQCAQIKDSLQRLMCYDRIFQSAEAPAAAQVGASRVIPVPAPVLAVAPVVKPALGDESMQRKSKEAKAAEPASLEAKVTALKETRPDVVRMTLDNGQVWQQMDMSSVFHVAVGDSVQIERSAMGSFRLSRANRGRSVWVRVTRLE